MVLLYALRASNRRMISLYGYERVFWNIIQSVSLQAGISGSRNILDISVLVCHWYISSQKVALVITRETDLLLSRFQQHGCIVFDYHPTPPSPPRMSFEIRANFSKMGGQIGASEAPQGSISRWEGSPSRTAVMYLPWIFVSCVLPCVLVMWISYLASLAFVFTPSVAPWTAARQI
ncbi:hypothetical protein DFP73DRAFT_80173 [Morchella snyderi]|nr:hypothetical protein DFP73DRAFT_80173 [Morchella snyderi]